MTKKQYGGNQKSTIIIVFVIIVLLIVLYGTYKYLTSYSVKGIVYRKFLDTIHDAKTHKRINKGSLTVSSYGNEYNLNFWIYIKDYIYRLNEDKIILERGSNNPTILLTKNSNTLRIKTEVENGENIESEDDYDEVNYKICDVKNIPLQRWVNINISAKDNVIDIFINGNLLKTCVINNYAKDNSNAIDICKNGGFNGFISNLLYTNQSLPIDEIKNIYKNGPQH